MNSDLRLHPRRKSRKERAHAENFQAYNPPKIGSPNNTYFRKESPIRRLQARIREDRLMEIWQWVGIWFRSLKSGPCPI